MLEDWQPIYSYLIPAGVRRRRCLVYVLNPCWDGVLKNKASARTDDPPTSVDAAESIPEGDINEVRLYVDQILARGKGVISIEVREFVLDGIAAGRIDARGLPAHVRAESLRRRFSDLCPRDEEPRDEEGFLS